MKLSTKAAIIGVLIPPTAFGLMWATAHLIAFIVVGEHWWIMWVVFSLVVSFYLWSKSVAQAPI